MKILLTGFNAFGGLRENPSQRLVNKFAKKHRWGEATLITEVLLTEFEAAGSRIAALIGEIRPDAVLCLGVAMGISAIRLERQAVNIDDSSLEDNAGRCPTRQEVNAMGPATYLSTLPLAHMRKTLSDHGFPVEVSNFAGSYVCNHVFYVARHEIERLGLAAQCGLVHIPLAADQAEAMNGNLASLSISCLEAAIGCLLSILEESF